MLTAVDGKQTNLLMQASIPIQSFSYCGDLGTNSQTQFCAGDSSHDSCQVKDFSKLNFIFFLRIAVFKFKKKWTKKKGDSGGPLVIQEDSQFIQVGIVSYGRPLCNGKNLVFSKLI